MRALSCLLWVSAAVAQPGTDPWIGLRANNPGGVAISLRLLRDGSYREGELIRAEAHYPGRTPAPNQGPPPELWTPNGYLLEPAATCGTLVSPCFPFFPGGGIVTGGLQPESPLVSLNRYLRPLRPGHYRVAALARKQVLINRSPTSSTYGYADPAAYALSNTIEFDVVSASPAWITQTLAASVAVLQGPEPNSSEAWEARRAAAEQLRFLDNPAAWRAALHLMPVEEYTLLEGLSSSSQPVRVCELMQSSIALPGQAVSSNYLDRLNRICRGELRSHDRQSFINQASAILAASVPGKVGEKKAIALQTLMERVQQTQPLPDWVPALKSEFIRSFATLDTRWQRQLLSLYANTLHSPDSIPLLESVLDTWKPGDYYEAPREALANLYALDPPRGQARIVAELKKDRTWLDSPQLALLPPGAMPITDDDLIQSLAAAQRSGGWNVQLRMTALAKYASPEALSRVKAIYESQQESCQPELMAYFVRVDPAYADRVFRSHSWDMQAEPPRCTAMYFDRTPRIAMGPVLEKYMAAYLMHRTVNLKKTAARSLGRFGSPAALAPLWDAFRYFHDYWKGKAAELALNREGEFLEMELRNAIARGRHWLATDTDLRTIESLCVSERCLAETGQDLRAWQEPLSLELRGDGMHGVVAQYYEFESLRDIEEKLGQFPKGTQFVLTTAGAGNASDDELRKYAASHGLTIVSR